MVAGALTATLATAGLATTTSTDAIMGALRASRFGAGSAINDTPREVGGALGVALLGSVMNSIYGPAIADRYTALGLPAPAVAAARESVTAALAVADLLPAGTSGAVKEATRQTFMNGLHGGSGHRHRRLTCSGCGADGATGTHGRRSVLPASVRSSVGDRSAPNSVRMPSSTRSSAGWRRGSTSSSNRDSCGPSAGSRRSP
jgi:hypothetical protein